MGSVSSIASSRSKSFRTDARVLSFASDLPLTAIYIFKKALILLQTISARYPSSSTTAQPFPVPSHPGLPIFSDNVIPTLLLHLGLFRLPSSHPLSAKFPTIPASASNPLLCPTPAEGADKDNKAPEGGPVLNLEEMTVLRAAAVHAVQRTVEFVKEGGMNEEKGCEWMKGEKGVDEAGLDACVWMGGKERADWRKVERFVGDSIYF